MRAWGIALLCLLTVVAGCSTGRATGEEAVANLHRLYTAGNYAEIYRSADPEYQKAGTESDNTRFFEGLVRTLGAFKTATPAGWRTFVGTGGRQITLVYESEFQKGHAKETFVTS